MKSQLLQDIVGRYHKLGLDSFDTTDGTPLTLKALLFNRYEQWLEGGPEDFKKWYRRVYRKEP